MEDHPNTHPIPIPMGIPIPTAALWTIQQSCSLSNHVLHALLPPSSTASQRYNLRHRAHSLQLPEHSTQLSESNFPTRMLWEHIRLSSLDYFLDLLFFLLTVLPFCFELLAWILSCHNKRVWLIGIGSKRLHGPSWFFAHRLLSTDPTLCSKDIRVTQKWRYFHLETVPKPAAEKKFATARRLFILTDDHD